MPLRQPADLNWILMFVDCVLGSQVIFGSPVEVELRQIVVVRQSGLGDANHFIVVFDINLNCLQQITYTHITHVFSVTNVEQVQYGTILLALENCFCCCYHHPSIHTYIYFRIQVTQNKAHKNNTTQNGKHVPLLPRFV